MSIAVPERRGVRAIFVTGEKPHFHVVLRNRSPRPLRLWATECSWGYPALRFEIVDRRGHLMKAAELDSFDDREAKPANIGLHIGRRPLLAFGNSDGDLAMLRYTKSGTGARMALLLHHDDAEREFAYDREFRLSPLVEALDKADAYGITVVSMKRDWKEVFDAGIAARTAAHGKTS